MPPDFTLGSVGFTSAEMGGSWPKGHAVVSNQNFGSGLLTGNPSQHAACSISEPLPGQRFLAVGNQDMSQTFTTGRKGCVEVFKETAGEWVWHQRLISPLTPRTGQWMGHAVRSGGPWIMCGNTHSITASNQPEGEIEAWKYNAGTGFFAFDHVLQPDDCIYGDEFGMLLDVDFESGWLIAGSPQAHDYNTATGGKIYFYKLVNGTWTEMQMFQEPGISPGDNAFGMEVCIKGNDAFASSFTRPAALGGGYFRGCLYHYKLTGGTWELVGNIPSPATREGQRFGATLHFDGTRLVSFDWGLKWYQGGFTVLRRNGASWDHEQTYIHPWGDGVNSTENHRFGHKGLFINDNTLVASERFAFGTWSGVDDMNGPTDATGIVYVFKRIGTTWHRTHRILPDTVQPGDWFGDLMTWDPVKNCLIVVSTGATRSSAKTMILNEISLE
jgi:hypothetical protein